MMEEMHCTAVRQMPRTFITPTGMENHRENFHYTPVVRVGKTVYMTGQVGIDPDLRAVEGREAHMVQAFENQQQLLDAAGITWSDVVELVSYHTDLRDLPLFMQIKDRYFGEAAPHLDAGRHDGAWDGGHAADHAGDQVPGRPSELSGPGAAGPALPRRAARR